MNKRKIFFIIFAVWLFLWVFFILREDKDDQYRSLRELYRLSGESKVRHVVGGELYDFLVFCRDNMPEGSTYELMGFEKYSIYEVRARYFLWPMRAGTGRTDFKIFCGASANMPGYEKVGDFGTGGTLLVRRSDTI